MNTQGKQGYLSGCDSYLSNPSFAAHKLLIRTGVWVVCFGLDNLKGYSIHVMYVYVLLIGDGDTVSSESPALPQEGVKRPATHDDSNPSPKKPRMDQ